MEEVDQADSAAPTLTRPEVINTTKRCQKVVIGLLLSDMSMPVVAVAFKASQLTGKIAVITLHSPSLQRPVAFDVYRNPKLYMEGQLHRVFQAEKLVKVVHDGSTFCAQLHKDHYIKCNAMFDTQVAYTLKMEQNGLPPRLIRYEDLHRNVLHSDVGQLYTYSKVAEKSDGSLWTKRPLPAELLYALGEEVTSLRLEVYPRVLSSLDEFGLEEFEMRCVLAGTGRQLTGTLATAALNATSPRPPLLKINATQSALLPHTKPLSSVRRSV